MAETKTAPAPADPTPKQKRNRSPNYPLVDVEGAIQRVELLHRKNKQFDVPIKVARNLWGYEKSPGAGNQCVAALKSYGLLNVNGKGEKRTVSVSDAARRIILKADDRERLIKNAATRPAIHSDLWKRYGDAEHLPDDQVIEHYLIFNRKFNEDVVDGVIKRFKKTVEFAKLDSSDIIDPANREDDDDDDYDGDGNGVGGGTGIVEVLPKLTKTPTPRVPMKAGAKQSTLDLDTGSVFCQWPAVISQADYADIETWLKAVTSSIKRSIGVPQQPSTDDAE